MLDLRQIKSHALNALQAHPQSVDARDKLALSLEVERLQGVLRKIEYASRKDSLTKDERLDEVRSLALAALS